MKHFIVALLRHRWLALAALTLSFFGAAYAARTIQVRFQYRDFYNYPGNAALPTFERDNALFGDPAGYVVGLIEAKDVFRPEVLQYVTKLSDGLAPQAPFLRVRSLSTVNAIRGSGDDVLTGRLMPRVPDTEEELARLRKTAISNPLLVRRLVSPDGTMTAVLAEMRAPPLFSTVEEQAKAVEAFEGVLKKMPPPAGVTVRLTGSPSVEIGTTRAILSDQMTLVPLVCVALGLILLLIFRSMHGVILCMSAVSVATVWTAGIFAGFDRPVDMMGSVIPTTLLVYGVVDPVFVLSRFLEKLDAGYNKHDAIVSAMSELALPCFLTSLTTAIGFAAFALCVAPSVQFYGITVGIGVMLSFVTTCTVMPLLLWLVPAPTKRYGTSAMLAATEGTLQRIGKWIEPRGLSLTVLSCVLLVAGSYFAREQHINNNYVGSLPRGAARDDVQRLEQKLFGVLRLNVLLEGPAGVMTRPEVLKAMESLDRRMEKEKAVTYSGSLADLVAETHMAFSGGDPAARTVPASQSLVTQYLTMVDPRDRSDYVTDSYAEAHIALLLKDEGSEATARLAQLLKEEVAATHFEKLGVKATVTGQALVAYHELDQVVVELLWGFVTAFSIVIALELLIFRSLRLALLTVIPNLIPVLTCFAATRIAGIPLRIDTILVLCVSIGGLFNTTIHFVARTLQLLKSGQRNRDAILLSSLVSIGPPSLFVALILSGGFALFLVSSFPGLQALGALSAVTLLSGFVSDAVFTPSLIRVGANWRKYLKRGIETPVPESGATAPEAAQ
jgi:predicted RND superfamily exporter protein